MKVTFLHTADWQLGKPFAGVVDVQKRALLQNERLAVLRRLAEKCREHGAEFVLVAGDVFDSRNATKSTVSAACSAIGSMGVPVYTIPGNHDHGGPGSLWEQEFFLRERDQLAPNLHMLLKPEPVELANAVIFPCPLLRRHSAADPTAWLRDDHDFGLRFGDKPRIVLAHGSVLNFGTLVDDEELDSGTPNLLDLPRLPETAFDFVALGDWHGAKMVDDKSWYSGTPELDRFVKGGGHDPGNVLLVTASRGELPTVERLRTGAIGWHDVEFEFSDDAGLERLKGMVAEKVGNRANQDMLRLSLGGSLGIEAATHLEEMIDAWQARLLRVKLENRTVIAPSMDEIEALTKRTADPLVSRVAAKLVALSAAEGEQGSVARTALRELHVACRSH